MFELMFCAMFTILPDFLIKRFIYKKRWGKDINFFSMWYEYRWGITSCFILTVSLITLIFYYHPSTKNVTTIFRTITILPEISGRVDEVFVSNHQTVEEGTRLFTLDSSRQQAAVETAESNVAAVEAQLTLAEADLEEADGIIGQTQAQLAQARDDLERKLSLVSGGQELISEREVEVSRNQVRALEGSLTAALARRDEVLAKLNTVLPAEIEAAFDTLKEAQVELGKTTIYAETSGQLTQLTLKPGDIVNPMLRPAGLLVPNRDLSGTQAMQAGFNQLAAQILQEGTLAEVTCLSRPFTIVPMVVTEVQDSIAAGQLRPTDQMLDLQDRARPGTITVRLEPLYPGGMAGIVPGSKCIANAYTNNHDLIAAGNLDTSTFLFYHMVDTVGLVHALLLRIQALIIPVQTLVFAGH